MGSALCRADESHDTSTQLPRCCRRPSFTGSKHVAQIMSEAKVTHKQNLAGLYRTLSQVLLVLRVDAGMHRGG